MLVTLAIKFTNALGVKGKQNKINIGITPCSSIYLINLSADLRCFSRIIYFPIRITLVVIVVIIVWFIGRKVEKHFMHSSKE